MSYPGFNMSAVISDFVATKFCAHRWHAMYFQCLMGADKMLRPHTQLRIQLPVGAALSSHKPVLEGCGNDTCVIIRIKKVSLVIVKFILS